MKTLHEEKMSFLPLPLKIAVSLISIGMTILMIMDVQNAEGGDVIWWFALTFGAVAIANILLWISYLQVKITTHDLRYKYPPLISNWRIIQGEHIRKYELKPYKWMKFGGWGYRFHLVKGSWAFTTGFNNHVLQIHRNLKKPLSIGINHPMEAGAAMEKMIKREIYE